MENVRIAIWDCDNVIWFHTEENSKIIAKELNIQEKDEFEAQFYDMIECFNSYFKKKRVTIQATYKIIEQKMPILYLYGISAEKFMNTWRNLKLKINQLNGDSVILMKYFHEKGIKNIIKSDWWRDFQEVLLKEYGVMEYVEEIHCCDNAYLKYNPLSAGEIIKPGKQEQYLFIGDSLTSDICFSNNAGIKSIWFNRDGMQNNTSFVPTFEVSSLLEVMEII